MVKLELLSRNLTLMLQQLLQNKEVVKYLAYNVKNPLSQPDVPLPATSLMFKNLHPYPFDSFATTEDCSQIRVYLPSGTFGTKEIVADTTIFIDIIVAKSLWLVNDGQALIRPYELMKLIVSMFSETSVGTLGQIKFNKFVHLAINERFNGIRIDAKMITLGTS